MIISLFAKEQTGLDGEERFLAEVCLPYSGPGGLLELGISPNGPPVPLRLALAPGMRVREGTPEELAELLRQAREGVRADRPCLALSVREVPVPPAQSIGESDWTLPAARRQVITLELQNAALQYQRHKLLPNAPGPAAEEPEALPSHVKQLQMISQENEQIRFETAGMRQKLERTKAVLAQSGGGRPSGNHDWGKTLRVMQQELAHCRERQRKIRANYEERVMGLQGQLQQARSRSVEIDLTFNPQSQADQQKLGELMDTTSTEIALMEQRISEATQRRNELMWRWNEAQRVAALAREKGVHGGGTPLRPDPEVERLKMQTKQNEATLERLRQELASMHEREREQSSEQQQALRRTVSQLYEELDELQRVREDERVRSESEVRELKAERDVIKDRLDDASGELQRLRSQSEALRAMRAQAEGDLRPSVEELTRLREENERRAAELQRLRECEEARKQTILELEREQEALVEKISFKAAQAVPLGPGNGPEQYAKALETKSMELSDMLERAHCSCQDKQLEVARLRQSAEEAKANAEVLRQTYEAMQRSCDERLMMRSLVPASASQAIPVVSCSSSIVSGSTNRSLN